MLFNRAHCLLLLCAARLAVAAPKPPPSEVYFDLGDLDQATKQWSELSLDGWDPAHDAECKVFMAKELAESGVQVNTTDVETGNGVSSSQLDQRAMCSNWWYRNDPNTNQYLGWTVQIRGYHNMYWRCSAARFPNDRATLVPLLREIVTRIKANNNAYDIHMNLFGTWTLSMSANAGWWYSDIPARLLSDMFGMTLQNMHRAYSNENGGRFEVFSNDARQKQLYSFFLRPSDCGADVNDYYNMEGTWPC
ncbi:hypothetical protein NQ176_g2335 [Zarea fungicola]|uniref:Uncharacterized protein n=1 Tax=Zarea fungicola TaxID=93591 RepID=A0ACC1NNU2_9HYPO|nr:hypothetical protein NQ176_g2335 [Lecanicillium fungicola]